MLEFGHLHTRGSGPNPNMLDPKAQSIWLVWAQLLQAFTNCAQAPLKKVVRKKCETNCAQTRKWVAVYYSILCLTR